MPDAVIRGIRINYEVVGSQGPWIALTPGGRRSHAELLDFAGMLAGHGYRVLLHDRRNCGASEVAFDGSASEHEIWADDLYELAGMLDALPLYVGGASSGARLSLLLTLRHPDAVKGMLLWRVTGGERAVERLAERYYGNFVKLVREGGMEAVTQSDDFSTSIAARPSNRQRLLDTDPEDFIQVMRIWREHFLAAAKLPIIGATEEDLKGIKVPVCIVAGNDVVHSPATARNIAGLIPNAELHDDVVEKREGDELLERWNKNEWRSKEGQIAAIFADFLRRNEYAPAA